MSISENINSVLKDLDEWNKRNTNDREELIEFSFENIADVDLSNRIFRKCIFLGVEFKLVNFDNSIFIDCEFNCSKLSLLSFVKCDFSNCNFIETKIDNTTIRDTVFKNCCFNSSTLLAIKFITNKICSLIIRNSKLSDSGFFDSEINNTRIEQTRFLEFSVISCTLNKDSINRFVSVQSEIRNSEFRKCIFNRGIVKEHKSIKAFFNESTFCQIRVKELSNVKCEIVQSKMKSLNLEYWNLSVTSFEQTHFEDCDWPDMEFKISTIGKLKLPKHIPMTPIQDITGVTPLLRKKISDSQYLSHIQGKCNNIVLKILFRLWGLTSGYGQSICRLFVSLSLGIGAISFSGILVDKTSLDFSQTNIIFEYIFSVFNKIIGTDQVYNIGLNPWITFTAQIFGIFWFALLIGVVITRITELGSE